MPAKPKLPCRLSAGILHHVTKHWSWHEQTRAQRWESTTCGWRDKAHIPHTCCPYTPAWLLSHRLRQSQSVTWGSQPITGRYDCQALYCVHSARSVRATVSCVRNGGPARLAQSLNTRPLLASFSSTRPACPRLWVAWSPLAPRVFGSRTAFLGQDLGVGCWLRDILTQEPDHKLSYYGIQDQIR